MKASALTSALAVVATTLSPGALSGPEGGPWFQERSAAAGVEVPHRNRTFDNPYAEIMQGYTALGAAAAVADFNGDGFDDIYVTDSASQGRNLLWRNNGDFTFTDVASEAGLAMGNDARNASADALWIDYDNDARPDLFLVRFGQSLLFRNRGQGAFQDVTREAGLLGRQNAICAITFDYDGDGWLDILLGRYFSDVDIFDPDTPRFFPENMETAQNGGGLRLWRNRGDGTFEDATASAGLAGLSGWTLDLGHADYDNDGDQDLYLAADFGTDRFFVNNGDGTFSDRTREAIGIDTKKGMNVDWGDYDNDGRLDVYVTNITDDYMREGNFLWHNNGDGTFSDVARETETYDSGWGWAGKFLDYDHDGWLDLYVVNGWVSAGEESYVPVIFEMLIREADEEGRMDLSDVRKWPAMGQRSLSGHQRSRLFHNRGGQIFVDQASRHGLDSSRDGRGIAVADFDNDGRLDLFVSNANAAPHLFRNQRPLGPDANWIAFSLKSPGSNRLAVGAQVRISSGGRNQMRFVDGGNGFASQSTTRLHFGLGAADEAEQVEIRWPSGRRQRLGPLQANRLYRITEGQSAQAQPLLAPREEGAGGEEIR
ncbi:MAG TPA: CRTAC1 family protein [Acidobacteriota bacterium]|nr:CRTAC1 family protein [Acidobacteriota bacterium]